MSFLPGTQLKRRGAALPLALALSALSFPSQASAAPQAPILVGTHPASPGLSTTPRIYGSAHEVITTALGPEAPDPIGGATAAGGEEGTIAIYGEADCSGPELASGGTAEFENSGIPVTVAPDSTSVFYATDTDASGISACSNGIAYRQVNDPPDPAVVTGVDPGSPADDNFPFVVGSAESGATVSIFTNPTCSGAPLAVDSAEAFSTKGIQVSVADNSTTTFYALASWAELPAPCSSTSATYEEATAASPPPVEPPPAAEPPPAGGSGGGPGVAPARPVAPRIHTEPGGRSNDSTPRVVGAAPGSARVDVFRNAPCTGDPAASVTPAELSAGLVLAVAQNATSRFYARSTDASGNASDCSAEAVYVQDSTPPVTRITFGPGVKTRKRAPIFRFTDLSDDPPGTSFLCKLDRRSWRPCSTPWKLSRLTPKSHLVRVRAIDAAGNEEAVAAKRRFRVVARPAR